MAKLTKTETRNHEAACELLTQDTLTEDQKEIVFKNWHEGATHMNGKAGAFFTPWDLAFDFEIDVCGMRLLDMCAGIGVLSYAIMARAKNGYDRDTLPEIVCVEINPDYVAIGKKLVPEATWICGDVTDPVLMASLGHFDCAYGNPPFGNIKSAGKAPRYTGADFEFKVMDIASDLADTGVFLIPQGSCQFRFSGPGSYGRPAEGKFTKFCDQTAITMDAGVGIDTTVYEGWKGVSPVCEVANIDFEEARANRTPAPFSFKKIQTTPIIPNPSQMSLFEAA